MDYNLKSSYDDLNNCWRVRIFGEVDIFNSLKMKSALLELIAEKNADVVIDCEGLDYMDSTALGALVAVLKNVKVYKGEIIITNIKPSISKIFKITNLDKVFVLEGDASE